MSVGFWINMRWSFRFKQPLFRGGASFAERDRAEGYTVYIQEEYSR